MTVHLFRLDSNGKMKKKGKRKQNKTRARKKKAEKKVSLIEYSLGCSCCRIPPYYFPVVVTPVDRSHPLCGVIRGHVSVHTKYLQDTRRTRAPGRAAIKIVFRLRMQPEPDAEVGRYSPCRIVHFSSRGVRYDNRLRTGDNPLSTFIRGAQHPNQWHA